MRRRVSITDPGASEPLPPAPHVIHRALSHDDGEPVYWVSIDGERWLPVQGEGVAEAFAPGARVDEADYAAIEACFVIRMEVTPEGRERRLSRMAYATRWVLGKWGAGATLLDPIRVGPSTPEV